MDVDNDVSGAVFVDTTIHPPAALTRNWKNVATSRQWSRRRCERPKPSVSFPPVAATLMRCIIASALPQGLNERWMDQNREWRLGSEWAQASEPSRHNTARSWQPSLTTRDILRGSTASPWSRRGNWYGELAMTVTRSMRRQRSCFGNEKAANWASAL